MHQNSDLRTRGNLACWVVQAIRKTWSTQWLSLIVVLSIALGYATPAHAHDPSLHSAQILGAIGFDQQLNAQAPLDAVFHDETGRTVRLGDYFSGKPVILLMGYFQCSTLCPLVRGGVLDAVQNLAFDVGDQFQIVNISINPSETPALAAEVKARHVATYNRPGTEAGWHFLTGDHENIDRVAQAIGFRYAYDAEKEEYAHASGIVVLTPTGVISRYLFGLEYPARDLRLGLVEAANNRIGNVIDQVLLFCYHYDPATGQYTALAMNILRLAGGATVLLIGGFLFVMFRKEFGLRPLTG